MTVQEAINELKDWQTAFSRMDKDMSYAIEAFDMAIEALSSAQPEHPLLKIIQDFKEMTGCEDVLVVQKDALKAWDENGVAYTMQPERKKGEWKCSDDMYETGICTCCGWDSEEPWEECKKRYMYCPNCGDRKR